MAILSFDEFVKKAGGKPGDVRVNDGPSSKTAALQTEADAANKEAARATSPLGIAAETAKGIGKTLIQDVTGTGKSIGEAAAASDVSKNITEGDSEIKDMARRVLKQIRTNREAGKDTSRLEQAYNSIAGHTQEMDLKDILPTLNKTNLEAVLEAVGTGATALSGGAFQPAGKAAKTAATMAAEGVANAADDALKAGTDLRKAVQVSISKSNASPQLKSSAERLFLDSTKRLADPVASYDTYLTSAKKALTDIKADPPLSQVGNSIGEAFKNVVTQRRAVGKTMADELKKVGSIRASIDDALAHLETTLQESGALVNGSKISLDSTAKLAPEDAKTLGNYVSQFKRLGQRPSVAEIDAFISRVTSGLEYDKSAKGITTTTNAERIIKASLNKLREQLDPTVTGNAALTKYADARKTYSQLSDFVNEGASYLGKITQSGDFAKDASLAKSSVQSILNNGKKDWLIKLEALTDYPALDDSVLALQAMKDAGDFRGLSLLQTLSQGDVPTSKAGLTRAVIDWVAEKGATVVAGSPEEQTRAFLKSLRGTIPGNEPNTTMAPGIVGRVKSFVDDTVELAKKDGQRGFINFGEKIPKSPQGRGAPKPAELADKITVMEYKKLKEWLNAYTSGGIANVDTELKVGDILDKHSVTRTLREGTYKGPTPKETFADDAEMADFISEAIRAYEDSLNH